MLRRPAPALLRALCRDDRGAALVEFAIVFPVLVLLIFGIVDFGRAFFLRNNLVAAVREGARAAAVMPAPCAAGAEGMVELRVASYVVGIGQAAPTNAQITYANSGGCAAGLPTTLTVGITNYPFTPITPVFRLINRTQTVNISVSATYRWERSDAP